MPEDGSSIDALSELLNRCLSRINSSLQRISGSGNPDDLEPLFNQLDQESARIQGLLVSLGKHLEIPRLSRPEIHRLVVRASDDVLSAFEAPVLLRTHTAPALPALAVPEGILYAALCRAMVLGASHAGPGGEMIVNTAARPNAVVFDVAAAPGGAHAPRLSRERCATLERFLEDIGGGCRTQVDDNGILHLSLELTAHVEHA